MLLLLHLYFEVFGVGVSLPGVTLAYFILAIIGCIVRLGLDCRRFGLGILGGCLFLGGGLIVLGVGVGWGYILGK